MPRITFTLLLAAAPLLASCDRQPTAPADSSAGAGAATGDAVAIEVLFAPHFNPDSFVNKVDNRFFPLVPGTRFIYVGQEDGERVSNVTYVTTDRKKILGINATVVLDRLFDADGGLLEKTFDWYAQDTRGNVWYLGEDTEELEDGKVVSREGSWEAGVNGAEAGIIMPAHPTVGKHYRQEFLQGEAEDEATIVDRGLDVTVPYGSFHNCLKTVEFTRLEPGIKEAKFYCPGVGTVKDKGVLGSDDRTVLKHVFN
jgi:hypothetical protein